MDQTHEEQIAYLVELYNMVQGDTRTQVAMHDVGAAMGLDKSAAGSLAEELIVEGLVELRTLAGGISITSQGLGLLQKKGFVRAAGAERRCLSGNPVPTDEDEQIIDEALQQIKHAVSRFSAEFDVVEELVIDIKTIEIQMLSPQPKTAIIQEVFLSLLQSCKRLRADDAAAIVAGLCR